MWNIGFYTSPLLATFLYRRGYFVMDSIATLAKISTSIGIIVVISMVMRGLGRTQSASYTKMIKAMEQLKSPKTEEEGKRALRLFDFEFKSWAVDFDVKSLQRFCRRTCGHDSACSILKSCILHCVYLEHSNNVIYDSKCPK